MTTVGDALSDLPLFDWVNPNGVIPQTRQDRADRERRRRTITQYEIDQNRTYVGENIQLYVSQPASEFQRKLRAGVPNSRLLNHVTNYWGDEMTERICNVPMRPGANHWNIPDVLFKKKNFLRNETAAKHRFYPGRFGRLGMNGFFQTCMTDIRLDGKNGKVCLKPVKSYIQSSDLSPRPCIQHSIVLTQSESMHEQWAFLTRSSSTLIIPGLRI